MYNFTHAVNSLFSVADPGFKELCIIEHAYVNILN